MTDYEMILLVCLAAGGFIIPFLTRLIQMPNAAGEIIYGLLLGFFFMQEMPHSIQFLGELGFVLLMYLAGLEIDFDRIQKTPGAEILIYLLMYLVVGVASFAAAFLLNLPLIFGLIFLTSAVGLLFPVLKDCQILHTGSGQKLLLIGTIGEIISLVGLTVFILQTRYGFSLASLVHLLEILLFGFLVFLSLKIYRYVTWWHPNLAKLVMHSENTFESSVRGNLAHMLVFVAVAAMLNLELIIGAFIGGMIFAAIFSNREELLHKMGSFGYGFLVPIFFITVGMKFELVDFLDFHVLKFALLITVLIFLVRLVASPVLLLTGLSTREMIATGLALTFPLTLLVALATFGLDAGVLDKSHTASILLAAILTSVIYPVLFKKMVSAG